jgi:hypothetical protein
MEQEILKGSTALLNSDNIAIVALSVAFFISVGFNWYLLKSSAKVRDVLHSLVLAVTILNERLNHHHVETESKKRRNKKND